MPALHMSLSGDLLAHIFHIHALYKQPTRGNYSRKGKLLVPPVSAHLLWGYPEATDTSANPASSCRQRGRVSGQREISFCLLQGNCCLCGPGVHRALGQCVCCCCPCCRKGDNAVSGEGTELRAAVALGRGVGAWLS